MKTKLLLLLSLVFLQVPARAQEIIPLPANANLDSLSKAFFAACDYRCLVLDAVKDRLVASDKPYEIDYIFGSLTINGKPISAGLQEKYMNKIKHLQACKGYKGDQLAYRLSLTDKKVYLFPIADLNFKGYKNPVYTFTHATDSLLINKLTAANLISLSSKAIIRYSSEGIWVNERKLSVKQERKFLPLLERITHIPASDDLVGLTYTPNDIKHYVVVNNKLTHF
ncbi:MAG: hypothetical protein JSS96_07405 [Bacteroidetes bacterium]|nr:hypothetical protein [Bacteroidota bacterium]